MTFSILARDPETGAIGGAAATGSLCVGGWVLRGDLASGMSASQGAAPSTFWGEDVLSLMRGGLGAAAAVERVVAADEGRDFRQLSALDIHDGACTHTGAHTGASNLDEKGHLAFPGGIAAGNMLAGRDVLAALVEGYRAAAGSFDRRLLAALRAARDAGGDFRGLLSAALLVLHPDRPPLTLRIDHHPEDPLGALMALHERATTGDYAGWVRQVPVSTDRTRVPD
ncbi:DUF1028 domain-containing protein [Pukyongiella litopenaei]|uniref:DUF1028 domain-containing protein n=1 Tax=Pukyongiella litopenaei TaxID=2605946 RepID=A0A2S0MKE0_9RHOB|nr:DUF1028 domain-containing protein [Pukyongiella litopenaei]AVO36297.1 DUF1028 domain-containing protein [Pukyongiella litopenaei]